MIVCFLKWIKLNKSQRESTVSFLRILYGKMQTKTGKDTSGRSNAHVRKNIVLRFLAGCEPEELNVFLDLVFEPFKPFISGTSWCFNSLNPTENNLSSDGVISGHNFIY